MLECVVAGLLGGGLQLHFLGHVQLESLVLLQDVHVDVGVGVVHRHDLQGGEGVRHDQENGLDVPTG